MNCKTIIPKNNYIRKEFFDSFYFKIFKETEDEYWLYSDIEKLTKRDTYIDGEIVLDIRNKISDKISEFCTYLNYTLDQGDWIPFVIETPRLFGKKREINIFTKYYAPSAFWYYGCYGLTTKEDWLGKFKKSGDVFRDDYEIMITKIENSEWFKTKI